MMMLRSADVGAVLSGFGGEVDHHAADFDQSTPVH